MQKRRIDQILQKIIILASSSYVDLLVPILCCKQTKREAIAHQIMGARHHSVNAILSLNANRVIIINLVISFPFTSLHRKPSTKLPFPSETEN